jgi:hypothetical protein
LESISEYHVGSINLQDCLRISTSCSYTTNWEYMKNQVSPSIYSYRAVYHYLMIEYDFSFFHIDESHYTAATA